jgi:hypothetical protein
MRRFALLLAGLVTLLVAGASATPGFAGQKSTSADSYSVRTCSQNAWMCTEVANSLGYYTGHDEPSALFYSDRKDSGNKNEYTFVLPKDPVVQPQQNGLGTTWNFQQHPAFWFGMAICDDQSAPEYTHECTPDSDTNIKDGNNPSNTDYIGYHAGTAFMEMQFYPPGWVQWPAGVSCSATQWCAALNIDSLAIDYNNNVNNNNTCRNNAGDEPVGFAFITKNGKPQVPANPATVFLPPYPQLTPDLSKDLLMNPGDVIDLKFHDTNDGLKVDIHDKTNGHHGSMTAGAKNSWYHVLFQPGSSTCNAEPYSFHPMYSTSSEHTRVPWAAHSYNVAFSDEIGHFEYCNSVNENTGNCNDGGNATDPTANDSDDVGCFDAGDSLLVAISGCLAGAGDNDFDGVPYRTRSWPGNGFDSVAPDPITFSSATTGGHDYDRVAFEADLSRIEQFQGCDRFVTGNNCTNPPRDAQFYPFFSTNNSTKLKGCAWTEGGPNYPGTVNNFGGSSATEYGQTLLKLYYPGAGWQPTSRLNDYRNVLSNNPCPAK